MTNKLIRIAVAFALIAFPSLAADFGDMAGTYTGKTAKGGEIVIVVPKSGTPKYDFRGSSVRVSGATVSGKTISMNVGPSGMGRVVIKSSGKGMSYKYSDGQGSTTATLAKQ